MTILHCPTVVTGEPKAGCASFRHKDRKRPIKTLLLLHATLVFPWRNRDSKQTHAAADTIKQLYTVSYAAQI